tara:strand:+ start:378 stop:788 length:411 start_codon:yes stop_codon:yes gene_type:complete
VKNIERPIGVSILSVLGYIGAGLSALMGILLLVGSSAGFLSNLPLIGILSLLGGLALLGGVILLGLATLQFFIARGLWKGQNWSRILTLVFWWIGGVSTLLSIFSGNFLAIISVAVYGFLIWYLQFKKEVKSYFTS